ncbi:hypothetical protein LTR66_002597 [Elasticomyces elasticus]|nr:hypothetical protein LTR66_002597 [Elasticomyces elasticus]
MAPNPASHAAQSLYVTFKVCQLVNTFRKRIKTLVGSNHTKEEALGVDICQVFERQAYDEIDRYLGRKKTYPAGKVYAEVNGDKSRDENNQVLKESEDVSESNFGSLRCLLKQLDAHVNYEEHSLSAIATDDKLFVSRQHDFRLQSLSSAEIASLLVLVDGLLHSLTVLYPCASNSGRLLSSGWELANEVDREKFFANLEHLLTGLREQLLGLLISRTIKLLRSLIAQHQHERAQRFEDSFLEFPGGKRLLSSTWPWSIRPSLAVLWGVCWMFYYLVEDEHGNLVYVDDKGPVVVLEEQVPAFRRQLQAFCESIEWSSLALEQGCGIAPDGPRADFGEACNMHQAAQAPNFSPPQPQSGRHLRISSNTGESHAQPGVIRVNIEQQRFDLARPMTNKQAAIGTPADCTGVVAAAPASSGQYNFNASADAQPVYTQGTPDWLPHISGGNFDFDHDITLRQEPQESKALSGIPQIPWQYSDDTIGILPLLPERRNQPPPATRATISTVPAPQAPNYPIPPSYYSTSRPYVLNTAITTMHGSHNSTPPESHPRRGNMQAPLPDHDFHNPRDVSPALSAVPSVSHSGRSDDAAQGSPHRSRAIQRPEPPMNHAGKFLCPIPECSHLVFDRRCEWSKHVDKHNRPYRCQDPACSKLQGFTYSGGLLRHEREVHSQHGGPKERLPCPVTTCKRHTASGFTRKENLQEHIRRVHRSDAKTPSTSRRDEDGGGGFADLGAEDETSPGSAASGYHNRLDDPQGARFTAAVKRKRHGLVSSRDGDGGGGWDRGENGDYEELIEQNKRLRQENAEMSARLKNLEARFMGMPKNELS